MSDYSIDSVTLNHSNCQRYLLTVICSSVKVVDFCEDDQDLGHVYVAPNKHNAMCGSYSTWTVISRHPDFAMNKLVSILYPKL